MGEKVYQLRRKIGLTDATLLVIGSVLGSGIFMTSGHMLQYLGNERLMLGLWLLGGIFTMAGGLCMAELGMKFPEAGGPYVYLREAYGHWAGFFFGWVFFWMIECGGIAALSVGFMEHVLGMARLDDSAGLIIKIGEWVKVHWTWSQVLAIIPIIILSIVNHYGIKLGILIQNISMLIRAVLLIVFLTAGFAILSHKGLISFGNIESSPTALNFRAIFLAMLAALWTYDGWYAANCTAEEMKRPEKDLPRAIILGITGITMTYLAMNILYVISLKASEMAGVDRVGEAASKAIFGPGIGPWMVAGIAATIFGCLCATIIYGPRVYFAMARDGVFFRRLGRINPKTGVPSEAIWAQALWSSLLCLTGRFQALYEYVVFSLLLFFAAIGGAIFLLGRKPGEKRIKLRGWQIMAIAGFFVLSCILIYSSSLLWKTKETLLGLAIVLSGWPAYLYWKQKSIRPKKSI